MKEFIEWKDIDHNGRKRALCPKCSHTRTNNKNQKCLNINHEKGVAFCHHCNAVSFKEDKTETIVANYTLPSQNWRNYTELSDRMVKWLESRKIPQHVAIELGWTEEKHYQPALKKEVTNIVFNSFERDKLVNKSYRSGGKHFTQSAGGKPILYNINAAIGQKELYIVEGQMDVAAYYAIGIKNVVSVPNGANDNDNYWINSQSYIEDIERFIISVDDDERGNELKEKIAQRLGRWRCDYIQHEGKDANDDLISGVLETVVKQRKKFPVSGTFTISDLMPEIMNLYNNGLPDTYYPKSPCFGNLKDIYSTLRGQVNVGTGIPSSGKSTFTDWYVLNLVKDYNMKASWFTPEHSPMGLYQSSLIEKVIGKNFWGKCNGEKVDRVSVDDIEMYQEWANERLYLTDAINGEYPTWDWLFEKFKEQMYSFGIDIFVIDAFNKVLLPSGNKLDEISKVLTKLTHFAQSNNVIVFLIAHPTKMRKMENGMYSIPTLYDVSGSADFRNMTHNGYTIYRWYEDLNSGQESETEFINMKTKFSFQGKMQESTRFKYSPENGRFYANGIVPRYNLITSEVVKDYGYEKQEDISLPNIEPKDAFETDEVPF